MSPVGSLTKQETGSRSIGQVDNPKTKMNSKIIMLTRLPGLTLTIFKQLLLHNVFLPDERLSKCVHFHFHLQKECLNGWLVCLLLALSDFVAMWPCSNI